MAQPIDPPRRLQDHQMAHHVGLDIGVGIDQRMSNSGLSRKVNDLVYLFVITN